MGKFADVAADGLQRLINFIGESTMWLLGLASAVLLGGLPAIMEVADDLTSFENDPIYWAHVAKIAAAGVVPNVMAYIKINSMYQTAKNSMPPPPATPTS